MSINHKRPNRVPSPAAHHLKTLVQTQTSFKCPKCTGHDCRTCTPVVFMLIAAGFVCFEDGSKGKLGPGRHKSQSRQKGNKDSILLSPHASLHPAAPREILCN